MNRDDIIRMAGESGMELYENDLFTDVQSMTKFAALVAAVEREECAKVVEQAGIEGHGTIAAALLVRERGAP